MSRHPDEVPAALTAGEKAVGALTVALVAATTWAMGGRAAAAPFIFTPLAILAALVACLLARREGRALRWRAFLPAALFALLVGCSLANRAFLPLPEAPWALVTRPGWIRWLPGTVDPSVTALAALPWLSALVLAGGLRQVAFSQRGVRLLWAALVGHGLLVAAVGTYFHLTDPERVLGVYRDPFGYHFATFIYRNHWAAYAILLLAVALGFSFSALRDWRMRHRRLDNVLPGLVAALLLALTLPMPGSRSGTVIAAGLLAAAFGLMVFRIARARRMAPRLRAGLLALLVVFALAVVGTGVVLNQPVLEKHWRRTLAQVRGVTQGEGFIRLSLSQGTLRMAAERPVWGWGIGSFARVFPQFAGERLRDPEGQFAFRVARAHNDWAQMWAEAGLVGLALFAIPVFARLRSIWRDRHPLTRWALVGLATLMAYALADFPFNNPAVLLLWVALFATAAPVGAGAGERRARGLRRVEVLGVPFVDGPAPEVVAAGLEPGLVVIPSAPVLVRMTEDAAHRRALLAARMAVIDSGLMVLLWRMSGGGRLHRVSGLAYLTRLLHRPEVREGRVLWVMPSADALARNLAWLRAQGHATTADDCYVAPRYPAAGPLADPALAALIEARAPRHVILALGGGTQERLGAWLQERCGDRASLHCVGAAIGFLSGDQVHIPAWADRFFLGWLFRCCHDPRRFLPRYLHAFRLVPLLFRLRSRPPGPATS